MFIAFNDSLQMSVYLLRSYGVSRGSTLIHLQSFIQEHGQKQAWVSTQQTDMNEARQRVFLGQAWVTQQGKTKRDNPGTRK